MVTLRMGGDVQGRDGKLGELSRIIVDREHDTVTDIVVRRGFLTSTEYRVPLSLVSTDDGELRIDCDESALEQFEVFDPNLYREPDPDYTGPPGWDVRSDGQNNLQFQSFMAMGPALAFGQAGPVLGFPGGEPSGIVRDGPPALGDGSDVVDSEGEKVGEVQELTIDDETGAPLRLVVKSGLIFQNQTEIPAEWVREIADDAVVLDRSKDAIEAQVS